MSETRKWVDLYPGKTHEFGTRVRVIGHARMNDNAVRLYYEEVHYTAPNELAGQQLTPLQQQQMIQEAEQTTVKKPEKTKREK